MHARIAQPDDAASIARIYNQGIAGRTATFETRSRTHAEIASWFNGVHPVVVVESRSACSLQEDAAVVAFGAASAYRPRECYAGIAEASVYVDESCRGRGAGRLALQALIDTASAMGFWKLVSRIFVENTASRRLVASLGFREVGIYRRHAQLDGQWRDVVIVECLLPPAKC